MKKLIIILSVVIVALSAFRSQGEFKPGIIGTVEPPDGVKKVWAINGTDSVSVVPLAGKFSLEVKEGNWKLVVEGMQPYKNAVVESVLVVAGQVTDVGVIKLPS